MRKTEGGTELVGVAEERRGDDGKAGEEEEKRVMVGWLTKEERREMDGWKGAHRGSDGDEKEEDKRWSLWGEGEGKESEE